MTGQIPTTIGGLSRLKELLMPRNELTGPVPSEIRNLQSIDTLVLDFNFLTGTLPDVFGNLTSLNMIDIAKNRFTGTFPPSFWSAPSFDAVLIDGNDFVGNVPDDFCDGLSVMRVDNHIWFLDEPKLKCDCCSDVDCYVWNGTESLQRKTAHAICPVRNKYTMQFEQRYEIEDIVAGVVLRDGVGFGTFNTTDICLSPTGCYFLSDLNREYLNHSLSFSSKTNTLEMQDQCDAVDVCGHFFDANHPRRKGLNHLTQLTVPDLHILENLSLPNSKALCWLMTEDPLFDDYHICDATLLQRYVMATFFFSQSEAFDFESFSQKPTCEWPGVTCDSNNKFIEHLRLRNMNMVESPNPQLGLLTRLISIDFRGNDFDGTMNPFMFVNLPSLELFDLSDNMIRGELPDDLLHLPRLKHLNMSNNLMVGSLPSDTNYTFELGESS